MELFGRTLDAEQVAGLVFLLMALGYGGFVLRGQLRERRWFKRRETELKTPKGPGHGGPWG
jgi:hypothetical protein